MIRVLVTGASGFLGEHLVKELHGEGYVVRALVRERSHTVSFPADVEVVVGDLRDARAMLAATAGCAGVVHLGGKAHVIDEQLSDATDYRGINVVGTRNVLEGAKASGVSRVVFASTVKVFGETTAGCVDESQPPRPETPYAQSKWEAEQLVRDFATPSRFTSVSLRLPMVYGPTQKGNLFRMIAAIDQGRFPALPPVKNSRSMLHVGNFVQAAKLTLTHPRVEQPAYVVTDEQPYAISTIYDVLRAGLGKAVPQWRVPLWMLKMAAASGDMIQTVTGRSVPVSSLMLEKLIGSAWYSAEAIRRDLGYRPPFTFHDAVPDMIRFYRASLR
jgi:UDP-glucose 4-epimerase